MRKTLVLLTILLTASFAGAQLRFLGEVTPSLQYILDANGVPTALQVSTTTFSTTGIAGSNGDTFTVGVTDNTALLTASTTATAVWMCADAAGAANCLWDTTGAGTMTIGSADVQSLTVTTDSTGTGEVVLPLQSIDDPEIVNDSIDGATLADTITLDAALVLSGQLVTMNTGAAVSGGDVTLSADATNGNAGVINQLIGVPRIKIAPLGTMVNGATNTVITDIGDSETPATDWTAVDGDVVSSDDTSTYRQGSASLQLAVAVTADATDGVTNALAGGNQNWTDDEAVGFWLYSTVALTAGDLVFSITDSVAGETLTNIPAYATINTWQWTEVDISGVANASKDAITDVGIQLSAAGAVVAAAGAFDAYFDMIVKWDVADEDTLGAAVLQDGVLSLTVVDATDSGATSVNLVEYTDYFLHTQTGNDAIVMITDQSGADKVGLCLVAY